MLEQVATKSRGERTSTTNIKDLNGKMVILVIDEARTLLCEKQGTIN